MIKADSILIVLIVTYVSSNLNAQSFVFLNNSSFEGRPAEARCPQHWIPCDSTVTPDILPGPFGVDSEPVDGDAYVGLIQRENGSVETISQLLTHTLEQGLCYEFKISLAKANDYAGYNTSIGLEIWLSNDLCTYDQQVFQINQVTSELWKEYHIQFTSSIEARAIIIRPRKTPGIYFDYKGNVLIDNISKMSHCDRS